jgi:uncharacterized protein HemX
MQQDQRETPRPVCAETFVKKSNLSGVVLTLVLASAGAVACAVAFGFDQRERISIVNERVDRHTEEIRALQTETKLQLDRIEQGITRLSPGRGTR